MFWVLLYQVRQGSFSLNPHSCPMKQYITPEKQREVKKFAQGHIVLPAVTEPCLETRPEGLQALHHYPILHRDGPRLTLQAFETETLTRVGSKWVLVYSGPWQPECWDASPMPTPLELNLPLPPALVTQELICICGGSC